MIKLVAAIRRRPGMTHEEYAEYIRDKHGAIASANKLTVRKYVQNHVFDSAYGATGDTGYQVTLPRDSVTELYFDDLESMGRAFADPYTLDVVGPDGANFSDLPAALSLLVEESWSVGAPLPGSRAVKVLHFLKAAEGATRGAFHQRWRQAHEKVLADTSGPAQFLLRTEWNTVLPRTRGTPPCGSTNRTPSVISGLIRRRWPRTRRNTELSTNRPCPSSC
jgi:hypothetical protein